MDYLMNMYKITLKSIDIPQKLQQRHGDDDSGCFSPENFMLITHLFLKTMLCSRCLVIDMETA